MEGGRQQGSRPPDIDGHPLSSAGVGRTGVFITLSIVLERMRYEGVVDMFQTVKTLRTQRPAMVQTEVCRPEGRIHVSSCSHQLHRQPAHMCLFMSQPCAVTCAISTCPA